MVHPSRSKAYLREDLRLHHRVAPAVAPYLTEADLLDRLRLKAWSVSTEQFSEIGLLKRPGVVGLLSTSARNIALMVDVEVVRSDESTHRAFDLPLPDCVGQVGHPLCRLRADRQQGHAPRVHALEQADSGAEQHG